MTLLDEAKRRGIRVQDDGIPERCPSYYHLDSVSNENEFCKDLDCKACWNREYNSTKNAEQPTENSETPKEPDNIIRHGNICKELVAIYAKKNADYGDSFHISFQEEGMAMTRIRLSDKLNRFKTLTKNNEQSVKDESIRDTLIDLANYAIMTIMEVDNNGND